jgi:hypothetical protein
MLTATNVILTLKFAVAAVTVLLLASLTALCFGRYRLHGRLNLAFFLLTLGAVLGLEVIVRLVNRELFTVWMSDPWAATALNVHLCFSVPSAVVLPLMLWSGLRHRRGFHVALGVLFGVLWTGTFVTGIFFLPLSPSP